MFNGGIGTSTWWIRSREDTVTDKIQSLQDFLMMFELLKDTDVSMMFDVTNNPMYEVLYVHRLTITSKQKLISPSAGVDKVIADIVRSTDSNLSSPLTVSLEC